MKEQRQQDEETERIKREEREEAEGIRKEGKEEADRRFQEAERIRKEEREEAERIRKEEKEEAERKIQEAREEAEKIRKEEREDADNRFQALLKSSRAPVTTSATPYFSPFDSSSELWADYYARFLTFVEANSIPSKRNLKFSSPINPWLCTSNSQTSLLNNKIQRR